MYANVLYRTHTLYSTAPTSTDRQERGITRAVTVCSRLGRKRKPCADWVGELRRMPSATPRSPGLDGAVGFTPRQHRVYDELVTRSGSR